MLTALWFAAPVNTGDELLGEALELGVAELRMELDREGAREDETRGTKALLVPGTTGAVG
jgi:hypothetical protein